MNEKTEKPFNNVKESIVKNLKELKKTVAASGDKAMVQRRRLRDALERTEDGQWTVIEDTLLDIEVGLRTAILALKMDKMPSVNERRKLLEQELSKRFEYRPEDLEIILELIPTNQGLYKWIKQARWKEEVDKRLRDENLFNPDKRAAMIQNFYKLGMNGNIKAGETWLKMSGDLTQKEAKTDKTSESQRKFVEALWKKTQK